MLRFFTKVRIIFEIWEICFSSDGRARQRQSAVRLVGSLTGCLNRPLLCRDTRSGGKGAYTLR